MQVTLIRIFRQPHEVIIYNVQIPNIGTYFIGNYLAKKVSFPGVAMHAWHTLENILHGLIDQTTKEAWSPAPLTNDFQTVEQTLVELSQEEVDLICHYAVLIDPDSPTKH